MKTKPSWLYQIFCFDSVFKFSPWSLFTFHCPWGCSKTYWSTQVSSTHLYFPPLTRQLLAFHRGNSGQDATTSNLSILLWVLIFLPPDPGKTVSFPINKQFLYLQFSFFFLFYQTFFFNFTNCISFAKYQSESPTGIHVFPILNPPPSPYHPSGSSQCTSPKHPVSCIEPGLAVFNLLFSKLCRHLSSLFNPSFLTKPL